MFYAYIHDDLRNPHVRHVDGDDADYDQRFEPAAHPLESARHSDQQHQELLRRCDLRLDHEQPHRIQSAEQLMAGVDPLTLTESTIAAINTASLAAGNPILLPDRCVRHARSIESLFEGGLRQRRGREEAGRGRQSGRKPGELWNRVSDAERAQQTRASPLCDDFLKKRRTLSITASLSESSLYPLQQLLAQFLRRLRRQVSDRDIEYGLRADLAFLRQSVYRTRIGDQHAGGELRVAVQLDLEFRYLRGIMARVAGADHDPTMRHRSVIAFIFFR